MARAKKAVSSPAKKAARSKSTAVKKTTSATPVNGEDKLTGLSRGERKKLLTRENLLVAIQELLLERNLEEITVNDITERADIGLGTFYNYFKSKKEVIDGLFQLALDYYHKELNQITDTLEDPAEILAASIVFTIQRISETSQLGWLLFDAGLAQDVFRQSIYQRAYKDFQLAIEMDRFAMDNVGLNLIMLEGSVMAVAEAIYRKTLPKKSVYEVAEICLRQLGLEAKEAKRIAAKRYPKVAMAGFPMKLTEL